MVRSLEMENKGKLLVFFKGPSYTTVIPVITVAITDQKRRHLDSRELASVDTSLLTIVH